MNASEFHKTSRSASLENESAELYDAIDRVLQDSFPASDAPSATVIVRVGSPAGNAALAAQSDAPKEKTPP